MILSAGMNLNERVLSAAMEYEPETYYTSFAAELEICASPMWSMLFFSSKVRDGTALFLNYYLSLK